MNLGSAEVHVWLAADRELADPPALRAFADLLEPHERERAARMRAEHLPAQYLVTRALQRSVLSAYAPQVGPREWRFVTGAHGKPALAPEFAATGLHFNIAHTAQLVAMAVSHNPAVGIDVEHLVTRRAPLEVAHRYFSAGEQAALAELAPDDAHRRFLALWSLKEAWIKATGEGLGADLQAVAFDFGDVVHATGFRMQSDDATRWRFWQGMPGEHVLALALRGAAEVRVFRRLPGVEFAWEPAEPPRRVRPSAPAAD